MTQETNDLLRRLTDELEKKAAALEIMRHQEDSIIGDREIGAQITGLEYAWNLMVQMLPEEQQGGFVDFRDRVYDAVYR